MRIRMLVSQAGPHISRRARCVYELPDVAEAMRLIESGQAEPVDAPPSIAAPVTKATLDPAPPAPETVVETDDPEAETSAEELETPKPKKPAAKRGKSRRRATPDRAPDAHHHH